MRQQQPIAIEFIGGPFDGHAFQMNMPPGEELAETAAFPVDRNVFRGLEGKRPAAAAAVTSVAIYRLISSPGSVVHQYFFVVSVAPEELHAPGRSGRR